MSKFQIVPSEEGISPEDAMLEFNSVYIPIGSVAERIHEIPDDQKNKIYGKMANTIEQKINKDANELGLTLNGKLHDNVEAVMSTYKAKIVELTEANTSLKENTDKASRNEIEKLTQKISDLTNLNEKLKNDLEIVSTEKQTIEANFTQKEIETFIDKAKDKAKEKVILVDNLDKRELVDNDYNKVLFKVTENKEIYAVDSNGNAIISKINHGKFADPDEIYNDIVFKREAYKKVNGAGALTIDKNEKTPIPSRIDLSSKVTLGKK
jgi:GTPase SAR1 family protein